MSWQSYVDDHLLCELPKGGCLTAAAIVGLDGGVWAQNDAFPNIEQSEVCMDPSIILSHLRCAVVPYLSQVPPSAG